MNYTIKAKAQGAVKQQKEDEWYARFSESLIEKIEKAGRFEKGWQDVNWIEGVPLSIRGTEYSYNCRNFLFLSHTMEQHAYESNRFATFNMIENLNYVETKAGKVRAKDANGEEFPFIHVLKGECGTPVLFTKYFYYWKEAGKRGDYEKEMANANSSQEKKAVINKYLYARPFAKVYTVFNLSQTNLKDARPDLWEKLKAQESEKNTAIMQGDIEKIDDLEAIINNCGVPVRYAKDNAAYYDTLNDKITLPYKAQFDNVAYYYATAIHEIAHSTGAQNRLNRKILNSFGTPLYAREELVAELSSACVLAQYGITASIDRSSAYLKSWLHDLRESPDFIKDVMQDVQKAVNYMLFETGIKQMNEIEIAGK